MKLYATTTSERATKGQGGNEYLTINITSEDNENIAQVNVHNDRQKTQIITTFVPLNCQESENGIAKNNKTRRYYTAYNSGKVKLKGKSQKGEKMYPYEGTMIKHCPECGRA